jgi:hypothetical protein
MFNGFEPVDTQQYVIEANDLDHALELARIRYCQHRGHDPRNVTCGFVRDTIEEIEDTSIVINRLEGCARCGGEGHDDLVFEKLKYPFVVDDGDELVYATYTHWVMCPSVYQPIMLTIIPEDDDAQASS